MPTGAEYAAAYEVAGNYSQVARDFNVHESTVRRAVERYQGAQGADPAIASGMASLGLETLPSGGWVKNQEPDELGRTYSFYVKPNKDGTEEDTAARIEELMRSIPAVKLKKSTAEAGGFMKKGFISINDLHAGAYAWADETGYGDWDLDIALKRLQDWVGRLVDRMPVVDEVILYYNGDTLHANGKVPLTPESGNVLDVDTRHFKVVDMTAASMCVVGDLAAQKHKHVRIVVKRGNHDEDSYLALLMAMKYRYRDQKNVTVEQDPSPYWAHSFGKVLIFGHHGDRVKPENLVMKLAADFRKEWGEAEHVYVWTAHKHQRALQQFPGVTWEQASSWTDPDAYGAYWGQNAMAQAVIYNAERGEIERFTVRP